MICILHAKSMTDRELDPSEKCAHCSIATQIAALQSRNARLVAEGETLRLLIDMTCDLELTNGLWLEKRDGKWDVHRGTTTLVAGATTDYAVKYVMGGAG